MKRLTCALFIGVPLIVAPLPAAAADVSVQFEVLPPGGVSCASWTRGRDQAGRDDVVLLNQQGVERAEREGWVSGYLTALNIEILPGNRGAARDLSEGIDRSALMAQIDDYCAENPLHSLLSATTTVSLALANMWHAAHPPIGPLSGEGARLPTSGLAIPVEPILLSEEAPAAPASVPLAELRSQPLPQTIEQPPIEQQIAEQSPIERQPSATPPPAAQPTVALPMPAPTSAPTPPLPPPPVAQAPVPAPNLRSAVDAVSGAALLQIGAYRTNALAQQVWEVFRVDHREIVRDLASDIQAVNLGERGIWHRLRVGPFSDRAAADGTCAILKARGAECFAVSP